MGNVLVTFSLDYAYSLLANKVKEGKNIEFKKELNLNSDKDRKEFLADVSSFANADGGDLIFGIGTIDGVASVIEGISVSSTDELVLQLDSIVRTGIDPRLEGFSIETTSFSEGKQIILLKILKSFIGPHRVIYKNHDKYYSRGLAGKYQMDHDQLKAAFINRQDPSSQIQQNADRLVNDLISGIFPIPMGENAKLALHLIPVNSVSNTFNIDVSTIKGLSEINGGSTTSRLDFHGWITSSLVNDPLSYNYLRVFRNGVMQAVNGSLFYPNQGKLGMPITKNYNYEEFVIRAINEYLQFYKARKISLPIYLFVNYIGIKEYFILSERVRYPWGKQTIQQSTINFPLLVIERYDQDIPSLLKPGFDMIWNACGLKGSYNYDDQGNWLPI
ncbi:MAG: ATP-binding protein [Chitinophagaceae bacterium]